MPEFNTTLTQAVIFDGMKQLTRWEEQISVPSKRRYDTPPRGAAGTAVLTYMWQAHTLLYWAILRAQLDKKEITAEGFQALTEVPAQWKEMGGDEALQLAAALPEKYRGVLQFLLFGRFCIRRMYKQDRPATANAEWVKPNGVPAGETSEGILDTVASTLGFSPLAPIVVAGWLWPVAVFGIGAAAAAAWYGSKRAEAGVAIDAEKAHSFAQAWRDIQIAQVAAANGQTIKIPSFVSRGAQIEAFQTSPFLIAGTGVAAGAATVGGIVWGMSGKSKQNPSHRRTRTCLGRTVEVSKYASGFRAWIIEGKKRGRSIDVKGARSYKHAFDMACSDIRKRKRKKNPAPAVAAAANPKKKKRKKKATKKKATKRKKNPAPAAAVNPKKKKRKKKATKKRKNAATTKETFIRRQMRKTDKKGKRFSRAQAESQWKGAQRMKGASGKKMRAKAKRARKAA